MLNKKLRVPKEVFQESFKKSKALSSDHILLRFYKPDRLNVDKLVFPSKFSMVVPKSVSKKAVIRNLIKRRGYSAIRANVKNIKKSYICIFSFKKGSDTATFSKIKEEITYLLKKSGIIDF
jgi:ribonuclease P protein component